MGQQEIYRLVNNNPRISSREIADMLNMSLEAVCKILKRMIDKDIKCCEPSEEEYALLLKKYPSIRFAGKNKMALNRIKLFEAIK